MKKPNPRKEFAHYLVELSTAGLTTLRLRKEDEFALAKKEGYCTLEACVYFDLAQIKKEGLRRLKLSENRPDNINKERKI